FTYVSNVSPLNETVATRSKDPNAALVAPVTVRSGDPHRTIAIVVDDLGIAFESMGRVRNQLRKFVVQEIRPNDLIAIIRTGGEVGALQQFTTDKRLLLRAVENLRWNSCSRVGISVLPPLVSSDSPLSSIGSGRSAPLCSGVHDPLGGTLQTLRFILQGMRTMPGRKSMLILSDNLPVDSENDALPGTPISATVPTDANVSESSPE